jgi:GMP synthase-like glutamine amidotransferase
MKIGICNVQGEISQRFGIPYDVPEQFRRFLAIAIPDLSVREYKVLESELPLSPDESDAYLITGSPAGVYDNYPWIEPLSQFIRQCDGEKVKLLGICFGHQLIAHILGGNAQKHQNGWNLGILEVEYSSPYKIGDTTERVKIFFSHQDQVTKLPPRAKSFARHGDCDYAGYIVDRHILCFQGHPEYDLDYMRSLLDYLKVKIPRQVYESAYNSLNTNHADPKIVAQWVYDFLLE